MTLEADRQFQTQKKQTPDLQTSPEVSELIRDIHSLSKPIAEYFIKRDSGGPRHRLSLEEEAELGKLIFPRNQLLIDLLSARNAQKIPNISVVLYKGIEEINDFEEKIHPFSDNGVMIRVPSIRNNSWDFKINVKLSGLRRKGLVNSSLDAELLLGEKTQTQEKKENFMYRTVRELQEIYRTRRFGTAQTKKDPQTINVINYLDGLISNIIIDRFVELKQRNVMPPDFNISYYSFAQRTAEGKSMAETAKISLPNGNVRNFTVTGQRIGTALYGFGLDYDNFETK